MESTRCKAKYNYRHMFFLSAPKELPLDQIKNLSLALSDIKNFERLDAYFTSSSMSTIFILE